VYGGVVRDWERREIEGFERVRKQWDSQLRIGYRIEK
jgi:hypothetical protein